MNESLNLTEDVKRDGMFSQIIKRLGKLEKFMNEHLSLPHVNNNSPKSATIWHDEMVVISGAAKLLEHYANQNYSTDTYQNPGANGDTFKNGFLLRGGTYTLNILCITTTNRGKLDLYIDDVLVASGIDFYSGAGVDNAVKTISGIVVTGNGYHVLKGVVNGKNAASTGFYIVITKFWFQPASF